MIRTMLMGCATLVLSGCASIPDVTYNYYQATWSSSVVVTQTVGCSAKLDSVMYVHSSTVSTSFGRDSTKPPFKLRIKDLDGVVADAEVAITFTDDGRLKSINQSSTGQGESVIKAFAGVHGTLSALGAWALALDGSPQRDCADIDKWGDKKPISLIYRVSLSAKDVGTTVDLKASAESENLYKKIQSHLPTYSAKVEIDGDVTPVAQYSGGTSDHVFLELQKTKRIKVTVSSSKNETVGTARVTIPTPDTYKLPIPKAALFGKQSFAISLTDAGAISSLGYGRTVGTAGALNALNAIASLDTPAAEAAELKAVADVLAQQQRIVLCQTKPDQCK